MTMQKLPGQVPDDEQGQVIADAAQHWRGVGNDAPVQAIARIEDAAKQLIGLNAVLQGLYFAAFALSDVRKQLWAMNLPFPASLLLLLFFLPIVFWLVSLYCSTRVFIPQVQTDVHLNDVSVGAWQQIKVAYEKSMKQKLHWLHLAHRMLVVSFAAVLLVGVCLAFLPPPSVTAPTPIIIITPTPLLSPVPTP